MRSQIIKIGNSRGVRIPAKLLKDTGIDGEVDITTKGKSILITPVSTGRRKGWEKAGQTICGKKDDALSIPDDLPDEE